jgi:putative two-component system response regulator
MSLDILRAKVLIVDDQGANVRVLEKVLRRAGYTNLVSITDSRQVLPMFKTDPPDIVLLDLAMPHIDGFGVMHQLQDWILSSRRNYLPVLVLTSDVTADAKQRSLSMGAKDFLTKPFDFTEVQLRVTNLLEARALHLELMDQNHLLEERVESRTAELWEAVVKVEEAYEKLRSSQEETIHRLSIAAEFRDDETAQHIHRMSHYCALLASRSGESEERSKVFRLASKMHDVGKIGTPDSILLKPGRLTPDERAIMEQHAEMGYYILEHPTSELLQLAATIALTHHEKVDGTGYPRGLRDEVIPVEGRISAIADVFDALTTNRVYRKAFPMERALEILRDGRGTHFDAGLLDLFFEAMPAVLVIKKRLEDSPLQPELSRRLSRAP